MQSTNSGAYNKKGRKAEGDGGVGARHRQMAVRAVGGALVIFDVATAIVVAAERAQIDFAGGQKIWPQLADDAFDSLDRRVGGEIASNECS